MFEAYKVAVSLAFTNHVTAGLALLSLDLVKAQGNVTALQKKLDSLKATGQKAAYELGAAFMVAAPFAVAIADAAKLQKEMIGIQAVTRGTAQEMDRMRAAVEGVAGQTMFSNIDVAKMAKAISSGTGLSAPEVTALLPEYAKFADVQFILKGTGYQKSVLDAVRLAHTAQHYDPDSLRQYLDLLTKASFIVPGGLGEVGNALKYSQGVAKTALGVDDNSMVLLTALMNRLGLAGSRGGTNTLAAMVRSNPGMFGSGLLTGKSAEALQAMGMADSQGHAAFFRNGKFDVMVWMKLLSDYVAKEMASHPEALARQDILKNFQYAFGTNGSRVASLLANPAALEQWAKISEAFQKGADTGTIQQLFADQSVYQKFENAKTNFTSAMAELGYTLLPDAADALTNVNSALKTLTSILRENPTLVRNLSYAFLGLAGALAFSGFVNLLSFALRGLTIALSIAPIIRELTLAYASLGVASGTASAALAPLSGILLAIAAAAGIITYHEEIASGIDKHAPWASNFLYNLATGESVNQAYPDGSKAGFAPPSSGGQPVQVNSTINLDGRPIAQAVTQHQYDSANTQLGSPSGFDGRMSFTPSGL